MFKKWFHFQTRISCSVVLHVYVNLEINITFCLYKRYFTNNASFIGSTLSNGRYNCYCNCDPLG